MPIKSYLGKTFGGQLDPPPSEGLKETIVTINAEARISIWQSKLPCSWKFQIGFFM